MGEVKQGGHEAKLKKGQEKRLGHSLSPTVVDICLLLTEGVPSLFIKKEKFALRVKRSHLSSESLRKKLGRPEAKPV